MLAPHPTRLADPALQLVRDLQLSERQVQLDKARAVLAWTSAHTITEQQAEETFQTMRLGGPGCPRIDEYDLWDLATAMGWGPEAATGYVAGILELAHRLPKLWTRVQSLEVALSRATRIADQTMRLPAEGAAWVDQALAHCAHGISWAQVEWTIATAIGRFLADEAAKTREKAADGRHLDLDFRDGDGTIPDLLGGTVGLRGSLDHLDALDLEAAVTARAQQLADLGSTETLDVRRSRALGEIARNQLGLDLDTGPDPVTSAPDPEPEPEPQPEPVARAVDLVVHVKADPTSSTGLAPVATVGPHQTPIQLDQLLAWLAVHGTQVKVRPVIDLDADLTSAGYQPSPTLDEQTRLRDRRCIFPFCNRRRTDADHIDPYDDTGPPGQTRSRNLGRCCRAHHRAKTHSAWTYRMLRPGIYLWTSPTGATYTVDRTTEP